MRSATASGRWLSRPRLPVRPWFDWAGRFTSNPAVGGIGALLLAGFLVFTATEILKYVVRARRVTSELIFGAVCVYLMMGIVGALLFAVLDLWSPGSLRLPSGVGSAMGDATQFSAVAYYSFVTLTTLEIRGHHPGVAPGTVTFDDGGGDRSTLPRRACCEGGGLANRTLDPGVGLTPPITLRPKSNIDFAPPRALSYRGGMRPRVPGNHALDLPASTSI